MNESKNYITSTKKYWDTSHWTIALLGFLWDDWYKLSQEEQEQFVKELQVVARKYKEIALVGEGRQE